MNVQEKSRVLWQDNMEEAGRRFLAQEFKIPPLPSEFENIPILTPCGALKDDFHDDELDGRTAIKLVQLCNEEICEMGQKALRSVQCGVSRQSIATLFLLAYQLKSPGVGNTKRVFPKTDPKANILDIDISYLDDEVIVCVRDSIVANRGSNSAENAKAYAYLAASFLRLFARPPEIFCEAWSHIVRRYKTFYSIQCPFGDVVPSIDAIRIIHRQFSLDEVFKSTLYRILYMSNMEKGNEGIKSYLYEISLTHTGIHIFPIFCKLCVALDCSTETLLHAIRGRRYEIQLFGLRKMIGYMADKSEKHRYQMWKYGRIFDHTFMSVLRTRACPKLVAMLASALQQERPVEAENIMNIRQLDDVSDVDKEKCRTAATMLISMVRDGTA